MTPLELHDIKENYYKSIEDFKQTWPLSRVHNLTLQEYTNLNRSDSFCYWLEAKTYWSGSIWGGSAFKFGIYEKSNKATQFSAQGRMSDDDYAWMSKYGSSREEVFEKVRSIIVQIIQLSQAEQFEEIGKLDLGDAVKWKIAFMYSDFKLFTVYKKDKLVELASKLSIPLNKSASFYELQKAILATKPADKDFLDFYMEMLTLLEPSKNEIRYWIYSPGEQASKWEEFYNDGIMALGWDELGDLSNYNDRSAIQQELIAVYESDTNQNNNAGANYDFSNTVKVGDIIIVKKGRQELLGYGEVESDYYFDDDRGDFKHCRRVKWKSKGNWKTDHTLVMKTLTDITSYDSEVVKGKKYYQHLLDIMDRKYSQQEIMKNVYVDLLTYKKQIILQGPPGTGKTREAKLIGTEMLGLQDVKDLENNDQFKLIQFHPSYTYEDFVRGIVAKSNGKEIEYKNVNKTLGLFAKDALANFNASTSASPEAMVEAWVDEKFELFKKDIEAKLPEEELVLSGDITIFQVSDSHFKYAEKWKTPGYLNYEEFKKLVKAILNGELDLANKQVDKEKFIHAYYRYTYYNALLKLFFDEYSFEKETPKVDAKNYVLVIDEINRANLSSVLGELIYALEYRGEEVESMYEVDGSQKLILPPNLYIIGTMNTADRSVGHIDYAIKRRFAFVDVLPEVLENSDEMIFNKELFEKVSRLFITNLEEYKANPSEKLKRAKTLSPEFRPEDIWLGHSYFIQKKEKDENGNEILIPQNFSMRLEYEIKPILQEYVKDGVLIGSVTITEGGQESEIPVDQYIHSL